MHVLSYLKMIITYVKHMLNVYMYNLIDDSCQLIKARPHYLYFNIRGLGFKFVDFLYKRSDVCHTEMEMP